MSLKILSLLKSKEHINNEYFDLMSCCHEEELNISSTCLLFKIQQYFPNIIKIEENTYRIPCSNEYKSTDFSIIDNIITLSYLYKCEAISGTEILLKLQKMAIDLKIIYIELQDASVIQINDCIDECSYSLSIYYILLYGISWYNKYGFISSDHVKNNIYNNEKRKLPFNKFIEKAIQKYDKDFFNKDIKSRKNIIKKIKKYFPEICIETPINDVIKFIDCYLKENNSKLECDNPKLILILEIIELAEYILHYNNFLRWYNPEL